MACKCYHAERNFIGKIGVCWGTKECEACSCGGDESKCDFYADKREKAWEEALYTALDFIPCWVSVSERLPEDGIDVLCALRDDTGRRHAAVGCYISTFKLWDLDAEWAVSRLVTHWMPLPEMPED